MRRLRAPNIVIDCDVLAELIRSAWRAYPMESLAFLYGDKERNRDVFFITGSVTPIYNSTNRSIEYDDVQLIRAWRAACRVNKLVLGDLHSHPYKTGFIDGTHLSRCDAKSFVDGMLPIKIVLQLWPRDEYFDDIEVDKLAHYWWFSCWRAHYPASLDLYISQKKRIYSLRSWLKIHKNRDVWRFAKKNI